MLAVVDDQQHACAAQASDDKVLGPHAARRIAQRKRAGERAEHAFGIDCGEIDPPDAVWEPGPKPRGGLDGEPRLPDSRRTHQGRQPFLAHQLAHVRELVAAADQACRRTGHAVQATDLVVVERPLLEQDHPFQPTQLLTRLQPELIGKHVTRLPVGGERVDLTAGAVEGEHQLRPRSLPFRDRRHPRAQLRDELAMSPLVQPSLSEILLKQQLQLEQALRLEAHRTEILEAIERTPAHERKGRHEQLLGLRSLPSESAERAAFASASKRSTSVSPASVGSR